MNRKSRLQDMPAERRLAAILAADVVGYSRLMGADEVGTLRALKAMRSDVIDPLIASHRGRIVKTTGDGLLAEFSSVVDAVTGAVAIQREMVAMNARSRSRNALTLRIGINIGDIIIDGEDIFGDGVNLAARLETLCEPGGVAISRAAHEQVGDKLDLPFVDLGEKSVKNIARPVRVYGLGARAVAALARAKPAPAAAQRFADELPNDEEEEDAPPREAKSALRKWRLRLILIAIAALLAWRHQEVRHAIDNVLALVATTRSSPQQQTPPAPAPKPALAPLPPPIFVPATPGSGDKPASPAAPTAAPQAPAAEPGGAAPPNGEKPVTEPEPLPPPLQLHPQGGDD